MHHEDPEAFRLSPPREAEFSHSVRSLVAVYAATIVSFLHAVMAFWEICVCWGEGGGVVWERGGQDRAVFYYQTVTVVCLVFSVRGAYSDSWHCGRRG